MSSISSILEFVSGACSGTAHAADALGEHGAVLGMHKYVGILGVDEHSGVGTLQATLRGHSARVNCVRAAGPSLFVSGAADGTARVWEVDEAGAWRCTAVLGAEGASVVAVAAEVHGGQAVVVAASTDGWVRVWRHACGPKEAGRGMEQNGPAQEIKAGKRGSALAVALARVDHGLLLATGGTDGTVRVYFSETGDALAFGAPVSLQGHEDWVTSVDFRTVAAGEQPSDAASHWRPGDVVLASASQDRHVRLWLITAVGPAVPDMLSTSAHVLAGVPTRHVALDGVLAAHDGWVHGARWRADGQLVTASADGSAMVWAARDVWTPVARLGGGGGLLGCASSGRWLLAHGLHGTLHLWRHQGSLWEPRAAPSGHMGAVLDVCWHPSGLALLSVSADQTARVFARVRSEGWREVARPQVHGYDMRAAAFLGPTSYVSAAEEKVGRVFCATRQFGDAWEALVGQPLEGSDGLAAGASQPVLGLSNKSVVGTAQGEEEEEQPANDTYSVRRTHVDVRARHLGSRGLPLEEQLRGGTLWAESDKLYAHAYELHTVAAGTTGRWAATSCRATSARHANVLIYHVPSSPSAPWPLAQQLSGHALTVTRMRFAQDDRFLLTVGRDRMWIVYERRQEGEDGWVEVARRARAHARIIWDAAWAPGARVFATASRDRFLRLWDRLGGAEPVALEFPASVTAVDFVPRPVMGRWVVAAALESGRLFVLSAPATDHGVPAEWSPVEMPGECAHVATVNRLAWAPAGDSAAWLLASVSDDHTLRITRITLDFN